MDKYLQFKQHVKEIAEKFKHIDRNETIRLISHLDADGISSASLMIKLMNKDNRKYAVSIVRQLTREILTELAREPHRCFVFTDLGSGQLKNIQETLYDREVFVLDHHIIEPVKIGQNTCLVNPHLFGIDGTIEISGAGTVYYFVRELDPCMEEYAYLALIGAMGDVQEKSGFLKLNNEILETAISNGSIKVIKGLRIFGAQTRPLHKVLEYSTDPFIPGVSGSESGSIQFLQQIGINPKEGDEWRKIVHLHEEELKKLVEGIIIKRSGMEKADDVLGNVYILCHEKKESPLRDLKEFSTLLNACGRMNKASLGIGACLGDEKSKEKAIRSMKDYKKELVQAINWFNQNKNTSYVIQGQGYLIVNAHDQIMGTIAGTLASMLCKSNMVDPGTLILAMAQLLDGTSKASIRIAGDKDIDLRQVMLDITKNIPGCEAGGHTNAAGALIPTPKEEEFIEAAKEVLSRKGMEEIV